MPYFSQVVSFNERYYFDESYDTTNLEIIY